MNTRNLLKYGGKTLEKYDYVSKYAKYDKYGGRVLDYRDDYAKEQVRRFARIIRISEILKIAVLAALVVIIIAFGVLHV
ncbi:hypothetical protein [Candidatus Mancarchaeum acidiphilum]|uniref:hypothetical protein n=1 Tax=Candidatus Mancarchaeum acidiphilum TaxID=1920749 RepID=UPI000B58834C|nr:hypothetical protein [Candidatus Mancarchaeum acidiphilum]